MSAHRTGFRRGFRGPPTSGYRASEIRGFHGRWRRFAVVAVVAFVAVDAYIGYRLLRDGSEIAPAPTAGAVEPVAQVEANDQGANAGRVQIGVPTISDRQVARLERQRERDERRGDGSRSDHGGSVASDAGGTVTTTSGSSSSTASSGSDDGPAADGSDEPVPTDDGTTDDVGGGSGGGGSSDGSDDDDDAGGGGPGGGGG
jgi:hypothetical protein